MKCIGRHCDDASVCPVNQRDNGSLLANRMLDGFREPHQSLATLVPRSRYSKVRCENKPAGNEIFPRVLENQCNRPCKNEINKTIGQRFLRLVDYSKVEAGDYQPTSKRAA